jgi:UDP-glucose 4-epimerase
VADIARANISAAKSDCTDDVFNIASAQETSLNQLAKELCTAMDRPELIPEHGPERSVNSVPRRLADITAAAQRLDWKPEIDLTDGLRGLVDWWRGLEAGEVG